MQAEHGEPDPLPSSYQFGGELGEHKTFLFQDGGLIMVMGVYHDVAKVCDQSIGYISAIEEDPF